MRTRRRRRLQTEQASCPNHATKEKESLPHISSDSDNEVDDRLQNARTFSAQKNPSKEQEQEQEQEHLVANIDALPDPFVLTSDNECGDSLEGGQSGTKEAIAGSGRQGQRRYPRG